MDQLKETCNIAIIGGGPAGLFMFKNLIEKSATPINVTIFEKQPIPGQGMPYSMIGAGKEHITNVSANEIPELVTGVSEWIMSQPAQKLREYGIDPATFNEYHVLPRLLFGGYLQQQFELLLQMAKRKGIQYQLQLNTAVKDIQYKEKEVRVHTESNGVHVFDYVIICTGHQWPATQEAKSKGWYDSPYPPSKLKEIRNVPVAIKGASLTAIDAVRTLSRANGTFVYEPDHLKYVPDANCPDFKMVLHSIGGLLPAIRFHLEDSHLSQGVQLTEDVIMEIREANDGFVPLDLVFEENFLKPLKDKHDKLYDVIKDMNMEGFVDYMMDFRKELDPFVLFKAEYKEAAKSIQREQSVYWKEMLAVLSYQMNQPAKYFSAEDMLRLKRKLMPLIAIIIAFVPQSSCEELLALHEAGVLSVMEVDEKSEVLPAEAGGCIYRYHDAATGEMTEQFFAVYINAVGQQPFMMTDFVFPGLVAAEAVSQAYIRFKDAANARNEMKQSENLVIQTTAADYWLKVPGVAINDAFQVLDTFGVASSTIYIMAVPHIAGMNPDYSGLDFCERASGIISDRLLADCASAPVAA